MGFLAGLAKAHGLDDANWRRHANPWSGWSRALTALPCLSLAIWSRVWIGQWAWGAVGLALLWIWLNPRLFPAPRTYEAWMSRGVLGERLYVTYRDQIAGHHRVAATVLAFMSLPGVVILAFGLWLLKADWVVFGVILAALPKFWFLDRMVWIQRDWEQDGREMWGRDASGVVLDRKV